MKMKKSTMRKLGRVLTMAFCLLLALSIAAGSMLEANADQVNNFFHTKTTGSTGGGKYDAFTPDEAYLNSNGTANTQALVDAHRAMGIALAEEGSVLLKNQGGALPLDTGEKLTLMGYRSTKDNAIYGMDIGSPEEASQNVSFQDALTEVGFSVNGVVCDAYNTVAATEAYTSGSVNKLVGTGYAVTALGTDYRYTVAEPSIDELKAAASGFDSSVAEYNGAAVIVLGRPSSEQADYFTGDEGRDPEDFTQSKSGNVLSLSDGERALLEYAKANFDKVVVILTTSNAMEIDELTEDEGIDAILWAGYPGNYGFIGVANLLAGKANPSGHLADTYASDSTASPAMRNWGLNLYGNYATYDLASTNYFGGAYVVQAEGIYTGYKYYETRYEDAILNPDSGAAGSQGVGAYAAGSGWVYGDEVTYPFGYGLSYTSFIQEITDVALSADGRTATVTVSVTNTGSRDGKSVVQVYAQSPYTDYDRENLVEKAAVQLVGFEKVEVAAGATETVTVEVDMQYLASYDAKGYGTYIMEQSEDYYFALGCNPNDGTEGAHAAINNILAAKGYGVSDGMDAEGSAQAARKFGWDKDVKTFATSKAGVAVENQLDTMDYNFYSAGTVTYLSRQDWAGTWPKTYTGLEATSNMLPYLQNAFYTLSQDAASTGFGVESGDEVNFTDLFGADFDDERWDAVLSKITLENAVRYSASGNRSFQELGEIYFLSSSSYVENGSVGIQKTLAQQPDENAPWYVRADDANAGYFCNSYGGAPLMAACWNKDLMREMGELWGNDALLINIPMVWAPSINLHRTPYNGRNGEYYSEDPVLSGYTALEIGAGGLSKGLITAIKHYAFNTQETSRLGLSTFTTEQAARENELRAFQIPLEGDYEESGRTSVLGIMTAYNRIGACYAGAHLGLMRGILRDEWDYNGYVTSDLAQNGSSYMPYIESILAGTTNFDTAITNDKTVWRTPVADLVATVEKDPAVLAALKENMHYSLWAFSQSNLANWMTDTTATVWVWNWWRAAYYGVAVLSGVAIAAGLALYVCADLELPKKKKSAPKKEGK